MNTSEQRVCFLYGSDEFAIAQRILALKSTVDREGMNTASLDARTVSEDELVKAVHSLPFLAKKRLVILANPSARYNSAAERAKFLDFLRSVPATTLVVLHENVAAREEPKHWLLREASSINLKKERFMAPRQMEMPGWIVNETRQQGGEIEPAAAARLAEMVGEYPRQAAQEITKLLTYVNYSRRLKIADIDRVSVSTAQANIFTLVDALATGNAVQAQKLLHQLLEEGDPFNLWGMILRQFRILLQAREVLDKGGTLQEAQSSINEAPYSVEKAFSQASRFTITGLESIHHHLLKVDEAVKNGKMPLELALELLVVELAAR